MRPVPDPGSFRDPASRVFTSPSDVFRGLSGQGLADYDVLERTRFYADAMRDGRVVQTRRWAGSEPVQQHLDSYAAVLRHEPLAFVSYPYEWSFGMLRDAALLTLELTEAALDEAVVTKDASAFNVQFRGSQPVFIDVGSFERARPREPWYGYLQFCQQFLFPLMLQAYRGIDFQPLLRGSIEGIELEQARRYFSLRDALRPGVLKHVRLHARLQRAYADTRSGADVRHDLERAGFSTELIKVNVRQLRRLVERLRWSPAGSTWSGYREENTYTDADTAAKSRFVEQVCARRSPLQVWDLGANDGHFSDIAAKHSEYVVALDSDHLSVEALYRRLHGEGSHRILPLVMDLASPSPALGWRHSERKSLGSRSRPDLVLALALVHHLAISRNVPLVEIVRWFGELAGELVVEFPLPEDPQVRRLLRSKRQGLELDYTLEGFEQALGSHFCVQSRESLPSGTRVLFHAVAQPDVR